MESGKLTLYSLPFEIILIIAKYLDYSSRASLIILFPKLIEEEFPTTKKYPRNVGPLFFQILLGNSLIVKQYKFSRYLREGLEKSLIREKKERLERKTKGILALNQHLINTKKLRKFLKTENIDIQISESAEDKPKIEGPLKLKEKPSKIETKNSLKIELVSDFNKVEVSLYLLVRTIILFPEKFMRFDIGNSVIDDLIKKKVPKEFFEKARLAISSSRESYLISHNDEETISKGYRSLESQRDRSLARSEFLIVFGEQPERLNYYYSPILKTFAKLVDGKVIPWDYD